MVKVFSVNDDYFMINEQGKLTDDDKSFSINDFNNALQKAFDENTVVIINENAKDPFAEAGLDISNNTKRYIAATYFSKDGRDKYFDELNFEAVKVCHVNDDYFIVDAGGHLADPDCIYMTERGLVRSTTYLEADEFEKNLDLFSLGLSNWNYDETLERAIAEDKVIFIDENAKEPFKAAGVEMTAFAKKCVVNDYFSDKAKKRFFDNFTLSVPRGFIEVCRDIDNYMRNGITKTYEVRYGVDLQPIDPKYERFIKHIAETEMIKENSMVKNVVDYVLEKSNGIGNNDLVTNHFGTVDIIGFQNRLTKVEAGYGEIAKQYARIFDRGFTSYSREGLAELKKNSKLDYNADVVQFDTSKQSVDRLISAFYGVCATVSSFNKNGSRLSDLGKDVSKASPFDTGNVMTALEGAQARIIMSESLSDLGIVKMKKFAGNIEFDAFVGFKHNIIACHDIEIFLAIPVQAQKELLDAYVDNKLNMIDLEDSFAAEAVYADGMNPKAASEKLAAVVYASLANPIEPEFIKCAEVADHVPVKDYSICQTLKQNSISCELIEERKAIRNVVANIESRGVDGPKTDSFIIDAFCTKCASEISNNEAVMRAAGFKDYKFCDFEQVAAIITKENNFEPKEVASEVNKFFNDLKKEHGIPQKKYVNHLFSEPYYNELMKKNTAELKGNPISAVKVELEKIKPKEPKITSKKYTGR